MVFHKKSPDRNQGFGLFLKLAMLETAGADVLQ